MVGCRNKVNKDALKAGTRVALDMTTLTIMRILPREVDPMVFGMLNQDPGTVGARRKHTHSKHTHTHASHTYTRVHMCARMHVCTMYDVCGCVSV